MSDVRIDVSYVSGPPRVIVSSGESMLSGNALSQASHDNRGLPLCALMLRPRIDLVGKPGHGLSIEVVGWSTTVTNRQPNAEIDDLGGARKVPVLTYHVLRVWHVLPERDLLDAIAIDIDHKTVLRKINGRWCNLMAFHVLEQELLSEAERGASTFAKRVHLVHDRMRQAEPGLSDAEIGARYGLGTTLIDYARALQGMAHGKETSKGAEDGFDELIARISSAKDMNEAVEILAPEAMDGRITYKKLKHAMRVRGLATWGLQVLWESVENADGGM